MKEIDARPVLPEVFEGVFEKIANAHNLTEDERVFLIYALDWFETSVAEMCQRAEKVLGFTPKTDSQIDVAASIACPTGSDQPAPGSEELLKNLANQPRCDLLMRAINEIIVFSFPL
jgi:hypothetical protein